VADIQVTGGGGMFSAAVVPVFVAESPAVTHSPSWLALVDTVIDALIDSRRPAGGLQLLATMAPVREGGYVLHEIAIAVPLRHG
jgi:hypothetical protein